MGKKRDQLFVAHNEWMQHMYNPGYIEGITNKSERRSCPNAGKTTDRRIGT